MKNISPLSLSLALCLAGLTTPAFADGGQRVLKVGKGVCSGFVPTLESWAKSTSGHGSYAVPVAPRSAGLSCDNPGPAVPVGQSFGFDNRRAGDAAALAYCNANKPADYKACVVIARTFTR